jgi:hypothetical protein
VTSRRSDWPAFLRHYLATLAYRLQRALEGAPDEFPDYRPSPTTRSPHEIVWHLTGLIGYARTVLRGGVWTPDRLHSFDAEIDRFHDVLEQLALDLESGDLPQDVGPERLLQGPLADAMTHVGQLAYLRRLVGSPVAPENFMLADIHPENLSREQQPARAPKPGWRPDQPPPAPGRPLE